jgi:RND family efflux transporter MFP subunit
MNQLTQIRSEDRADQPRPLKDVVASWPVSKKIAVAAVPIALLAGVVLFETRGATVAAAPPPPTVTVAAPLSREIAEWDDYSGRFEASKSVELRPRVSGAVLAVHFADGAVVRRGQLLYTIDPRPFQAALAEARAAVMGARSDLSLAQADYGRAQRLVEAGAVSRSDLDRLRARVLAAEAAVAAAGARVQQRALDVGFTRVHAPISGRISDRRVDPGNLVQGGGGGAEGTLLTTINALDPVYFTFDASEALFLKARRARESGAASTSVDIRLQDEADYRWRGRLDFADNGLDRRSGTIRLRAVVANPTQFLTPGMFGNMRLSTGAPAMALLVPDSALQTDQARKVVMVLGPDGSLVPRPVTPGPLVDGLRVIRAGLARTDKVAISGAQLAMPGARVQVRVGRIEPQQAAVTPASTPASFSGEASFAGR